MDSRLQEEINVKSSLSYLEGRTAQLADKKRTHF